MFESSSFEIAKEHWILSIQRFSISIHVSKTKKLCISTTNSNDMINILFLCFQRSSHFFISVFFAWFIKLVVRVFIHKLLNYWIPEETTKLHTSVMCSNAAVVMVCKPFKIDVTEWMIWIEVSSMNSWTIPSSIYLFFFHRLSLLFRNTFEIYWLFNFFFFWNRRKKKFISKKSLYFNRIKTRIKEN